MIPFTRPMLEPEDLAAIKSVLDSGWLGYGEQARVFEAEFASHIGVEPEHVIFLNSATAGTFLAFELLGLGEGDEVVMPSISFNAAANAVVLRGARIKFCEVDPWSLNPRVEDIAAVVTDRTKAVVVLHYGGHPGEVDRIAEFCAARGLALIEDASCAPASQIQACAVGTFGDMSVWSLDTMKIMVSGDGGLFYSSDLEQVRRARRLAYHGLAVPGQDISIPEWQNWEFKQIEPGWRLLGNDLTAALGSSQLRRLPKFIARRKQIWDLYDAELAALTYIRRPPPIPREHCSSYYTYWVKIDGLIRDYVAQEMYNLGVSPSYRYGPLHRSAIYEATIPLPLSEEIADTTLCLPLHQGMTDDDARTVIASLRKAIESAPGSRL